MKKFKEHDSVVYKDEEGRFIDTFVIFETDDSTGLTHINYMDLLVPADKLKLHPKTEQENHVPVSDDLSFELFKMLKEKYSSTDTFLRSSITRTLTTPSLTLYSKAS
jgi:hypothetical protein